MRVFCPFGVILLLMEAPKPWKKVDFNEGIRRNWYLLKINNKSGIFQVIQIFYNMFYEIAICLLHNQLFHGAVTECAPSDLLYAVRAQRLQHFTFALVNFIFFWWPMEGGGLSLGQKLQSYGALRRS